MNEQEKIEVVNSSSDNVEYIKIMKSETLKGGIKYNWDFKLLSTDVNKAKELNSKLLNEFANENGTQ